MIGVKMIARLMIKPALVAEVIEIPKVSMISTEATERPKTLPANHSARVMFSRLRLQITTMTIVASKKRSANNAGIELCGVRFLAAR